jgi:hypothetical protein
VLLLAACGGPPQNLPPEWEILEGDPGGLSVSQPVLLVADNQLHNLYADPVELRRTGLANRLVPSAIRPAQLDLYGPSFMEHVIEKHGGNMPVLHLGDACDLSCTGEFARFAAIMRGARKGWMMAPGNHDGYLFGNEQADTAGRLWQAACRNSGVPMNKALYVRLYLAALALQADVDAGCRALAARLGLADRIPPDGGRSLPLDAFERLLGELGRDVPREGRWPEAAPGPDRTLLRRIRWKIDHGAPWRSYVVQEVDLTHPQKEAAPPPLSAALIDTCDYGTPPALLPIFAVNSGLTGEMGSEQSQEVRRWMREDEASRRAWVLMHHHPYDALSSRTRTRCDELRTAGGVPFQVTAHTHAGRYILHGEHLEDPEPDPRDRDTWLELNLGSILDWPLEYRTLEFSWIDGRVRARNFRSFMERTITKLLVEPADQPAWEAKPGEPDDYLKLEHFTKLDAPDTELRLRRGMLAAFDRRLGIVPTDPERGTREEEAAAATGFWPPGCGSDDDVRARIRGLIANGGLAEMTAFLLELERFDRARPKDRKLDAKFRLNSALWASKYKTARGRRPLIDDWFIVFPKPRTE